jgi:hypothetical protein
MLPHLGRRIAIQIGEDEIEDLAVPGDGPTLDAFFDVLQAKSA